MITLKDVYNRFFIVMKEEGISPDMAIQVWNDLRNPVWSGQLMDEDKLRYAARMTVKQLGLH